jgi:hypothetical protein
MSAIFIFGQHKSSGGIALFPYSDKWLKPSLRLQRLSRFHRTFVLRLWPNWEVFYIFFRTMLRMEPSWCCFGSCCCRKTWLVVAMIPMIPSTIAHKLLACLRGSDFSFQPALMFEGDMLSYARDSSTNLSTIAPKSERWIVSHDPTQWFSEPHVTEQFLWYKCLHTLVVDMLLWQAENELIWWVDPQLPILSHCPLE